MGHIIERFIIHYFCSAGAVMASFFAFASLLRRYPKLGKYLPSESFLKRLIFISVVILLAAFSREAWDVYKGQPIAKAFTDYASWALGLGCSIWAIIRIRGMRE